MAPSYRIRARAAACAICTASLRREKASGMASAGETATSNDIARHQRRNNGGVSTAARSISAIISVISVSQRVKRSEEDNLMACEKWRMASGKTAARKRNQHRRHRRSTRVRAGAIVIA